jgi:hypothetical protein
VRGRRFAAGWLIALWVSGPATHLACHRDEERSEPTVLRVSGAQGLGPFVPSGTAVGAVAQALALVFDPLSIYADVVQRRGGQVVLQVKEPSGLSAGQLAAALQFEGLEEATVDDRGRVVARLRAEEDATWFASGIFDVVRNGPFELVDDQARPLVLRAREARALDTIEIHEVPTEAEWRLLLSRHIDVIPVAGERERHEFGGIESIRLVGVAPHFQTVLYVNVRNAALASAAVRARLAAAIDSVAIARVVCGDPSCAAPRAFAPEEVARGNEPLPPSVTLHVVAGTMMGMLIAEVIRSQLRDAGVAVAIYGTGAQEMLALARAGDYQLLLGPLTSEPLRYTFFRSGSDAAGTVTGYENPEYDQAVASGDHDRAEQLLARDLPMLPLLTVRDWVAIDGRFCGDVAPRAQSWRWMADLRPCRPGEMP